ncbi:MAG: hypothetical protein QXU18_11345 [Thermoplasmatales archaeon]
MIVTDKLLTGFDAPILYAMYLDKPIRDHTLLQAIARINRPYEYEGRKKIYGLVVDFVGIFNSLKKALAFDSSDVADIESVLQDIDLLKKRFSELMDDMKNRFLIRLEGTSKDKVTDKILEIFETEMERTDFAEKYDEINDIYEILSPDQFLGKYLEDYKTLSKMYRILMEAYGNRVGKHRDLSEKTAKLVRDNSILSNVPEIKTTYEINSKAIEELEKVNKSDREKVFNLLISLRKLIEENITSSPYLISIGERAEKIAERHNSNQITTEEALKYLKELAKDAENAREEEKKTGFSKQVFAFYYLIKTAGYRRAEELASTFAAQSNKYPSWFMNSRQEREIKLYLVKEMLKSGSGPEEAATLTKEIIDKLKRGLRNGTF